MDFRFKTFVFILFFIFLNSAALSQKQNELLIFKSVGARIGHTTNEYGWHHPFPVITQNYHDPGFGTVIVGAYIEGLSTRYYSTMFDITYHGREMRFDYDLFDGNGNVIGTNTAEYNYNITSFIVTEKLKYSMLSEGHELEFYGFGGFKLDLLTSIRSDWQQRSILSGYKSNAAGLIVGVGFSVGKSFRFSTDFYYAGDFTNTYDTEYGNFKNTEFGIVVGLGYNNIK